MRIVKILVRAHSGWSRDSSRRRCVAQPYPSKPVKLIVTYPPGGSSDLMARILGQKLSELWGQPVLVESKPGAAGSIGMEYAKRQPPDGYSFVIGNLGPVTVNPILSKVPYDVERDFVPVSLIATGPNILVVNPATPVKTLGELIAYAQGESGQGQLRLERAGKRGAPERRDVQEPHEARHHPHRLQGRHPLGAGPGRGPRADGLLRRAARDAVHQVGAAAGARRHRPRAQPLRARHPHLRRIGHARPRRRQLVGRAPARRHAQGDRAEVSRRHRQGDEGRRP